MTTETTLLLFTFAVFVDSEQRAEKRETKQKEMVRARIFGGRHQGSFRTSKGFFSLSLDPGS